MSTFKAVIIEKNANDAILLKKMMSELHPNITIVAEAYTIAAAKETFLNHQPHIAFMAIDLSSGTSFDVLTDLNLLGSIDFEIIFMTTNQRYVDAVRAIDFAPIALLNKPIDPEILRGVIGKAITKRDEITLIQEHLAELQTIHERITEIIIPSVNHNKVAVAVADITHFKAEGQTTIIHFHDGTSLIAFSILGYFKKMLLDKHDFFLIHNSLLVNTHQVKAFKYAELELTLKNGKKLIASRRNGKEFKKHWEQFK